MIYYGHCIIPIIERPTRTMGACGYVVIFGAPIDKGVALVARAVPNVPARAANREILCKGDQAYSKRFPLCIHRHIPSDPWAPCQL